MKLLITIIALCLILGVNAQALSTSSKTAEKSFHNATNLFKQGATSTPIGKLQK
nr:hypothetical protein [Sunxiuqinia sp.]